MNRPKSVSLIRTVKPFLVAANCGDYFGPHVPPLHPPADETGGAAAARTPPPYDDVPSFFSSSLIGVSIRARQSRRGLARRAANSFASCFWLLCIIDLPFTNHF